jgi:hypothetical protein
MLRIRALFTCESRFLLPEFPGRGKPSSRIAAKNIGSRANDEHGRFEPSAG